MVSHTAYIQQSKLSSGVHDSSHDDAVRMYMHSKYLITLSILE